MERKRKERDEKEHPNKKAKKSIASVHWMSRAQLPECPYLIGAIRVSVV
jgi:hypothetical protein